MKIAMFTDTFTPQVNGVVTSVLSLSRGLAEKGHKIIIIAPANGKIKDDYGKNISVIRAYSIPALFYEDFKFTSIFSIEVMNILRKENIDIIHFHTPITLGFQAIIMSELLRIPLVGTFHTFFCDPEYLRHVKANYKVIERVSWAYARLFYNRCDLVTCPTESAKKELKEKSFKKPIKVISNGINIKEFDNSKSFDIKEKFNKEGKLLLFVGRIAHEKNLSYLLDCFRMVLKELPTTRLLIVGDGPQMDELKENAKDIADNIIITGRIEHEKLVKSGIFGACDLFVTASETETQGITMLEAQANGLVSVALDAKGARDLIRNGNNGFLVKSKKEFADKIVRLLKNDRLRSRMKRNTLREIKKHEISKVLNTWENEYRRLVRKSKSPIDSFIMGLKKLLSLNHNENV